jgi:type I restriction enzyme, S subunit
VPSLSRDLLYRIKVPKPPNPEQAKIAEILSTVDRAIEQTEALIAKQQRVKIGLMQDLLTRGIDRHGNLRSEQAHEFKDSPLGRVPVEWDIVALGDCGDWASGGTPSKAISRFWGGEVPWVCPKDMKTFALANSIDRITQEGAQRGSRLMPSGTVFIVIRGMILAHTFPVGYATRPMAFNQDVKAVVPKPALNSRYLAYWLVAHAHAILKMATTATHGTKRFDMDDLFAVSVAIPKPKEQALITNAFDGLQHQIDLMRAHSGKLRSLRTGLMQDLLTGKRRVTALLTEPKLATA